MALPPRLAKEIEQLDVKPDVKEDGGAINLIFRNYPIPPGYSCSTADLLVRVPLAYPDAGPDMFWTSVKLTLQGGRIPQAADALEVHVNEQWRRFSWHHQPWKPSADNIHGYLQFIRQRLERAC